MTRLLGLSATAFGAFDLSRPFLAAAAAGLRLQGRLGLLAQALVSEAFSAIFTGDWNVAISAAEEAGRLARETTQPVWAAGADVAKAMVAALRGEPDIADQLASEAEEVLLPIAGLRSHRALIQIARGLGALSRGAYTDAFEQLHRMFVPADRAYSTIVRTWAIGDLAEAAVHAGYRDAARAAVGELEPLAKLSPVPVLHAGMLYSRPLLSEDADAEALFLRALSGRLAPWPFLEARTMLACG